MADQKPKKTRKLTARQARFVAEYLVDLNACQAAIRAGYSPKVAETCGPRLLRNAQVADAISKAKEARTVRTEITQDRVLEELAALAFSDVTHYSVDDAGRLTVADGAPPSSRRAISSIKKRRIVDKDGGVTHEVEIKLWDKPGPLKLAGRHVGLFPDRVEITGKNGGPVEAGLKADGMVLDMLKKLAGEAE
jgi:phage terminase small subunit